MSTPWVLFVDDEQANLTVFEVTCANDFPIATAIHPHAALEIMRSREVGVLIADQRMPDMTGVELLERVQREYPDTVRILISAYSDLNVAVAAINQGHVRRYMRKPWVPEELRAILKESLDIYNMSHRLRALEQRLLQTERVYALGVVAAGIAQELKEPTARLSDKLGRAKQTAHAALEKIGSPNPPVMAIKETLEDLNEEISDAVVGVQRVLDIVRGIELPTRNSEDESADLGEVLRLTLKLVRRELQQHGEVRIDVQSVPRVRGSSTKLGQVTLNLLMNAAQSLSRRLNKSGLLTVRLRHADGFVTFDVLDNGPGFTAEELVRMFDPLVSRDRDSGTNLGLAISKAIVEELGGRLEATNQGESGSLFRVALPVAHVG